MYSHSPVTNNSVFVLKIKWMFTKSGDTLLDQPSREYQNLPPKLGFKVVSQQTGNEGCTRDIFSTLAISMERYASLGCISGFVLLNVSVLKKYLYASWERYFSVTAPVVPSFFIWSDRLKNKQHTLVFV
jgi:hypothetical protein